MAHTRTHYSTNEKNVVPIALCFALTLPLGNLAYVFLSVSFIQMLKAFTPAIVMVVAFLFGVETPDSKVWKKEQGES